MAMSIKVSCDDLIFSVVRTYARLYGWARVRGYHLRGLEPLSRLLRVRRMIEIGTKRIAFEPTIATSYIQLLGGKFNEPETHALLRGVMESMSRKLRVQFLDVGANVGEFLVDLGDHPRLHSAIGFEPVADCVKACQSSIEANHLTRCKVLARLISSSVAENVPFHINTANSTGSRIESRPEAVSMATSMIDLEVPNYCGPAIMLIDVEGYEIEVLRGARQYILRNHPLIVFEYNHLGRRRYCIEDVRRAIGQSYEVYRLRADGRLDDDLEETWNCVAICRGSVFWPLLGGLLSQERAATGVLNGRQSTSEREWAGAPDQCP